MQTEDSEVAAKSADSDGPHTRRWLNAPLVFGFISLVLVLIVLAIAEVVLQSMDFPYDPDALLRPHFVSAGADRIETNPLLANEFKTPANYQSFAKEKPAGTLRVAILGGSSVYLLKDAPIIKAQLAAAGLAEDAEHVEVLNMGVCGCGSDRAMLSAKQALEYEIDALLLYSGHNEFISESNSKTYRQPGWLQRSSKLVQLFGNPWQPEPGRFYDEQDQNEFYRQFETNLRSIAAMARESKVPLVWGTVSANLVIPPKVYDEQTYDQSEVPMEPWLQYKQGVDKLSQERFDEAVEDFRQSFAISPRPWRATSRINEILRATAADLSVPLADVEQEIINTAPHGIPGIDAFAKYQDLDGLFNDHCHLNDRGNVILQRTFADVLTKELKRGQP